MQHMRPYAASLLINRVIVFQLFVFNVNTIVVKSKLQTTIRELGLGQKRKYAPFYYFVMQRIH